MATDNGLDIHISGEMLSRMRQRGHGTSGTAVTASVIRWQGMLNAGEEELAEEFTEEEAERIVAALAGQAREDRLTHKEFWGLSAQRIGETVALHDEKLGRRVLGLGELAALALKERAGSVLTLAPGVRGRPKG